MKIEIYEIESEENKVYLELLERYKTDKELQTLLNVDVFSREMMLMGDGRLIATIKRVINYFDNIKVYLVKDTDKDTFLWVIGQFLKNEEFEIDEEITMFPLKKKQSKKLQLEIRKCLIEKGLIKENKGENNHE